MVVAPKALAAKSMLLAANAALVWEEFDQKNDLPGNPLAKVSSRPDFVGSIYPGPSFFARGGTPVIPRAMPPVFITCATEASMGATRNVRPSIGARSRRIVLRLWRQRNFSDMFETIAGA